MTDKPNREEARSIWWLWYEVSSMDGSSTSDATASKLERFAALLSARQEQAEPTWNEAIEAAAKRVEGGSFLHDEAPSAKLAREAAKAIRSLARPSQPQEPIKAQAEPTKEPTLPCKACGIDRVKEVCNRRPCEMLFTTQGITSFKSLNAASNIQSGISIPQLTTQEPIKASADERERFEQARREGNAWWDEHKVNYDPAIITELELKGIVIAAHFAGVQWAHGGAWWAEKPTAAALSIAQPAALNNPVEVEFVKKEAIANIIKAISELQVKTGPDSWPDAMLVTADELRDILEDTLVPVAQPAAPSLTDELIKDLEFAIALAGSLYPDRAEAISKRLAEYRRARPAAQTVVPEGFVVVPRQAPRQTRMAVYQAFQELKADDTPTWPDAIADKLIEAYLSAAPQPVAAQQDHLPDATKMTQAAQAKENGNG